MYMPFGNTECDRLCRFLMMASLWNQLINLYFIALDNCRYTHHFFNPPPFGTT